MRIIDHNKLNNFLFGKERKTNNRNEKRNKALPATVFSEIPSQKFEQIFLLDFFYIMQIFYKTNTSLHKCQIGNVSEIAIVRIQQWKNL